jgi:hypothetical protein
VPCQYPFHRASQALQTRAKVRSVLDEIDGSNPEKYGRRYARIVDTIDDAEHRATIPRLVPRGAA